uniref:F-box domain-containing protein n=1 Tax=Biomphalaria glabrata TaxID=6526 RepID=A0A2C9JT43_BIOGL
METSCKSLIQENQEARDMINDLDITFTCPVSSLHILEMPDSIFLHIFTYLPFSSIGAVSQVCSRWNRICYDELMWRSVFLRHFKLPSNTVMPQSAKSWRLEFKRLYYHTPAVLSEERKEHKDEVLHVSFSHDGTKFATCSKDGFFKVWQCTDPVQLLFKMDMKSTFSWKFTQFSQFNETDTCLLVSGVYFGRLSTSGEIAVFNLQDGYKMQCRVTNKPYDVFGAWYDNDHLLSGTLYWTGDFNSVSAVWLSKASQEVESEIESVSMVLYRFENVNSSSIRLLHVAEIDQAEQSSDCNMEKDLSLSASSSSLCPDQHQELASGGPQAEVKKHQKEAQRNCLLDKLLSKVIAEDEFDIENEDDTDVDDEELNEIRISDQDFETCESSDSEICETAANVEMPDSNAVSISGTLQLGEFAHFKGNLSQTAGSDVHQADSSKTGASFQNSSNIELEQNNVMETFELELSDLPETQDQINGETSEDLDLRCCNLLSTLESSAAGEDDSSANLISLHSLPSHDSLDRSNSSHALLNFSHSAASSEQEPSLHPSSSQKPGVGQNIGSMLARAGSCDIWDSDEGAKREASGKRTNSLQFMKSHSFDDHVASCSKTSSGASSSTGSNSSWRDYYPIAVPCFESTQETPAFSDAGNPAEGNMSGNNISTFNTPSCPLSSTPDQRATKSMCTNSIATQTEGIASRASSFHSLSHMSHSSSLSPDLCTSTPREKLLIYTWGSETYIPHKIGIKRMRWSDFSKGEVTARRSSMLLPDVMENLHNMAGNRRDKPDVTIEMHGHIVGLSLSPDHKFLYVNCRPWPKNYIISDPQESPPLAQEVEISTIDLTTFNFVGPVLRSHKAYTHSDECFFLNLDVSEHYVASGAEDRQGYLWDRHYGVPLYRFPHRNVVNCVAINPQDPELLVTVSDDYTFKVWISRCKAKERAKRQASPDEPGICTSKSGV